jgi:hypothetical protein
MQTAVDTFTIFGSIVAIITGGFVIWERFFRHSPIAFATSDVLVPGGQVRGCYLRIRNRSERPIIVSWPTGIQRNELRVSVDHERGSIIQSLLDGEKAVIVDGMSDGSFVLHPASNWKDLDLDQTMEIVIKWRFVQPMIYQFDRNIHLSLSKRAYLLLIDELNE